MQQNFEFGNLQTVANSTVNKEDFELQNTDYNFNLINESIKDSRSVQQDDIKAPVYSTVVSTSYNGSSCFVGESTLMREENTTDHENTLYEVIDIQEVGKISSCPASSQSPPEESKLSENKNVTPKSPLPSKTPVFEECLTTSDIFNQRRARPTEKEKEDPFYDFVPSPHMPAIPLSGDSVQLKENTAYNTTETVTSPQVQPNIAYGTVLH